MSETSKLDELMNKEVTRSQFLMIIGGGIASLFGISSILGLLAPADKTSAKQSPIDYGVGHYGP